MTGWRFSLCVLLALFFGCAATSTPTTTPAPFLGATDAGSDASDGTAEVAVHAAPTASLARFEPIEVAFAEKGPIVEILSPIAEQSVPVSKATGLQFRLAIEGWAVDGVACALDGERPRRYVKGMKLGDLLPDAAAVAEGPHLLTVAAVRDTGEIVRGPPASRAPYAMVHFWVGERNADRPETPRVVLFEPSGTYNGETRANGARVDFLAAPGRLGVDGGRVRVTLKGVGVSLELLQSVWQPLAVRDLPSGDFDIEVSLLDDAGKPVVDPNARARRTISVNRDAPVPRDE